MPNCGKCKAALPAAAAAKAFAFCPACGFKNEFGGALAAPAKTAATSMATPKSATATVVASSSMNVPKAAQRSASPSPSGFDPSAFDAFEQLGKKKSNPASPKVSAPAKPSSGFDPSAFDAFEQLDTKKSATAVSKPVSSLKSSKVPVIAATDVDTDEDGNFWCMKCDGLSCGPMDKFKCDCGHYVRDHTDKRPANAKPSVRKAAKDDGPAKPIPGTYNVAVAKAGAKAEPKVVAGPLVNTPGPRPGTSICPTCKKVVYVAEKITACGVDYHPICLRCSNPVCKKQLFAHSMVQSQGKPWCSLACTDIKNHVARDGVLNSAATTGDNCAKCGAWISDGAYISNGLKYHKHCHEAKVCLKCGGVVAGKYVGSNGAFYHAECFGLDVPCPVCKEKLTGKMTSINGMRLHARCFNCRSCSTNIVTGYLQKGDDYYCENCYNDKFNPIIVETITTYSDGKVSSSLTGISHTKDKDRDKDRDRDHHDNEPSPRSHRPERKKPGPKVAEAEVFDDTKKDDYVLLLAAGAIFVKHGRNGAPHEREVFMANNLLLYCEVGKRMNKSSHGGQIDLTSLKMVMKGKQSEEFQRETAWNAPEDHCFTIIGANRALNCECASKDVRDRWVEAFFYFRHIVSPAMVQKTLTKPGGGTLWAGIGQAPKDKEKAEDLEGKAVTAGTLKQGMGVQKVRISRGAKEALSITITRPPAAVNWSITVQDHSVGVECIFRASDSKLGAAEPAQVKMPYARVRSEEGIATGCFGVDGAGELLFTIDNSFSLLTDKVVDYRFEVLESK